jgi:peptide/nickel transport system permease protein
MGDKLLVAIGSAILAVLLGVALLAPRIAPHSPSRQNLEQDLLGPSREHPLGTDKLGRDILSRTLYGARVSLLVGTSAVAVSLLIGVLVGSVSGYFVIAALCLIGWTGYARLVRAEILAMRAREFIQQFLLVAPHLTTFPGLAIMLTVLGLNLVGDGLRDRLEKKGK